MESKKSNKITEIVRLQRILKKWKKLAITPKNTSTISSSDSTTNTSTSCRSIKFLKRTLSFTDVSSSSNSGKNDQYHAAVRKGFVAVCVGKELKRFTIPMEYLGHPAFGVLLREAEEEFGFQQEGVLKIPCEVSVFEKILKLVEEKKEIFFLQEINVADTKDMSNSVYCSSSDSSELAPSHPPQMCR